MADKTWVTRTGVRIPVDNNTAAILDALEALTASIERLNAAMLHLLAEPDEPAPGLKLPEPQETPL